MANIPYNKIQVFPVSNIPSIYRFGLTTEQNMTDTFKAIYQVKNIDGVSNDGFVADYNNSIITVVVAGYFIKIDNPTSFVASASDKIYINMNITSGTQEGSRSSNITLNPDTSPKQVLGISVDSSVVNECNTHLLVLEKVNGVWRVPESSKIILSADRLGGKLDCGEYTTDTFGLTSATTFVERENTFGN